MSFIKCSISSSKSLEISRKQNILLTINGGLNGTCIYFKSMKVKSTALWHFPKYICVHSSFHERRRYQKMAVFYLFPISGSWSASTWNSSSTMNHLRNHNSQIIQRNCLNSQTSKQSNLMPKMGHHRNSIEKLRSVSEDTQPPVSGYIPYGCSQVNMVTQPQVHRQQSPSPCRNTHRSAVNGRSYRSMHKRSSFISDSSINSTSKKKK